MIYSPLDIQAYSRSQMTEAVMAIAGRSADNPRKFRDWLESLDDETLSQEYRKVCGTEDEPC